MATTRSMENKSFHIEVIERGEFECSPDQTLVQAQSGLAAKPIPTGCLSGGCGTCKVLILKGQVEHPRLNSIACSPAEQEQGYVLACQSKPKSDLTLEV